MQCVHRQPATSKQIGGAVNLNFHPIEREQSLSPAPLHAAAAALQRIPGFQVSGFPVF